MFQRIVVPLDGSARAERALPVAARLAHASGGTVVVLRVVRLATEVLWDPTTDPGIVQKAIAADVEEARAYLEGITRVSSLRDIHTETNVIVGQAADIIL